MDIQFYRNTHFLGSKIKHLRTLNNMTLEVLSVRCYQINDKSSTSISYLSLIENGKRSPSQELMLSIRTIFQKEEQWFYDKNILVTCDQDMIKDQFETIDLEPNFLYSKEFFKRSTPTEKTKFLGFVSSENSDKISELPISKPKLIFLLNIFSKDIKSLSVILKPWPTKGCTTCKASPNNKILSL